MKRILITGASGFIGSALSLKLSEAHEVIGLYNSHKPSINKIIIWEQTDLLCKEKVDKLLLKYTPDIVIHCAAVAHQRFYKIDRQTYFDVNSVATENIARATCEANMASHFIFLSSISVYGENNLSLPINESHAYHPTSDYGKSKLDAENRLLRLYQKKKKHALTILRLAPVYDKEWSFNLDRRVLSPFKFVYLKFGSGRQQMSALARPNLTDFIKFIVSNSKDNENKVQIINATDAKSYEFNKIIRIFLKSLTHPVRPVIKIPASAVFLITRIAGLFFPKKREWIDACYEKLASSLIFDNTKMLKTGFKPKHNLETVYLQKNKT